jgi:DDE superfamily endonuclease
MVGRTWDWKQELGRFLKPFLARLGHKARRQMCPLYVLGLIGPGDRKSIQPMAERLARDDYDQLHHFIAAGVWDATPVETELLVQADRLVGGSDAVLVIDDTAIPKTVTQDNVIKLAQPGTFSDPLTEILRNGARALLAHAVEAEVAGFLGDHADKLTADGRARLVRHGHLPEREIVTGIGPVAVRCPRVRDRTADGRERIRFSSAILPPYARRSKSLEVLPNRIFGTHRTSSADDRDPPLQPAHQQRSHERDREIDQCGEQVHLHQPPVALRHFGRCAEEIRYREHVDEGGVLEQDDGLGEQHRHHVAERLRQHDVAHCLQVGHAERLRRRYLTTRDRLDTGAHDLGEIRGFEQREGDER